MYPPYIRACNGFDRGFETLNTSGGHLITNLKYSR